MRAASRRWKRRHPACVELAKRSPVIRCWCSHFCSLWLITSRSQTVRKRPINSIPESSRSVPPPDAAGVKGRAGPPPERGKQGRHFSSLAGGQKAGANLLIIAASCFFTLRFSKPEQRVASMEGRSNANRRGTGAEQGTEGEEGGNKVQILCSCAWVEFTVECILSWWLTFCVYIDNVYKVYIGTDYIVYGYIDICRHSLYIYNICLCSMTLLSLHMNGWMYFSAFLLLDIMFVTFVFIRYNLAVGSTTSQKFPRCLHRNFFSQSSQPSPERHWTYEQDKCHADQKKHKTERAWIS